MLDRGRVRWLALGLALSSALTLSACGSTPAPLSVAVFAELPELEALAGAWSGSYWSGASGRSGRITFSLELGESEALGEVLMFPKSRMDDDSDLSSSLGSHGAAERIGIRFVRTVDGKVDGTTESYVDPACGCRVTTRFTGARDGDVIEGSYVSDGGLMHWSHSGHWRVERDTPSG